MLFLYPNIGQVAIQVSPGAAVAPETSLIAETTRQCAHL
jgi:hypothetical protein